MGVVAALALALVVALPWLVDVPRVHAYISQAATQALGRPVRFASLSLSPLPVPSIRLRGLEVADEPRFAAEPLLRVAEGRFRIRLWPLLAGRVELAELRLDRLDLHVVEDHGRINLLGLGPAGAGGRPAPRGPAPAPAPPTLAGLVSRVHVTQGLVRLERRGRPGGAVAALRLEGIDLTAAASPRGDALTLEGRATGQPGGVRLALSGGVVTLAGRALADATLRGTIGVEVADATAALAAFLASPGLGGPVRGRLTLGGTVARPTLQGELEAARLLVSARPPDCGARPSRPLPIEDVRVPIALAPPQLDSAPARARVAGGTASVVARLGWAASPELTLRPVEVKGVQLGPVLVDLLCQGFALTGPLDWSGEARMDPAAPARTLHGRGRFHVGPGEVVGAGALAFLADVARLSAALSAAADPRGGAGQAPVAFDAVSATYTITAGVARTEDLLYRSRALTVAAAGTYGLADTRVDMAVTATQGRTQVKARVVGTTTPRALQVIPVSVRSGEAGGIRRLLERLFR